MSTTSMPQALPVRTWRHTRKGIIRGIVVFESAGWADILLVGDQVLTYQSAGIAPMHADGDIITVRTALLTEVTDR